MNTNRKNPWVAGSALSWIIGATLGLLLGVALLIVIPRTLGGPSAAGAMGSTATASGAAQGTGSTGAAAGAAAGSTGAGGTKANAAAAGNAKAGQTAFTANCAGCHGANAEGGVGPALGEVKAWSLEQFAAAVRQGKAPDRELTPLMPRFSEAQLSAADLGNVHAYIQTLN